MKYSVSWLLLASLAVGSVHAAAPIDLSGSIFIDAQVPFEPTDTPNNFYVSRARMDFKGQWSPTWSYKIRVERPAKFYEADKTVAIIPSAVISWKLCDDKIKINFGKDTPRYSQVGVESQSYIERSLGALEDSIGQKLGANISGVYNEAYGYSLGIWSATARSSITDYAYSSIGIDSDIVTDSVENISTVSGVTSAGATVGFSEHSIRPAMGGRVNAIVMENGSFAWGSGFGVQSLDVIVPMIAEYTDGEDVYHNTFEKRLALTVDQSMGWGKYTFNTAFHFFKYYRDVSASSDKSSVPAGINAYQSKNQASSGYIEITRLLMGEGYKIDPACGVVNKIIPNEKNGSVEVALRVGREYYYNAAAAQFLKDAFNDNDAVPLTFTSKTGYNLVSIGADEIETDFCVKAIGYTLSAAYVMNKNIAFKTEYYQVKTSSRANGIVTTLEKEQGVRVRSEYTFS